MGIEKVLALAKQNPRIGNYHPMDVIHHAALRRDSFFQFSGLEKRLQDTVRAAIKQIEEGHATAEILRFIVDFGCNVPLQERILELAANPAILQRLPYNEKHSSQLPQWDVNDLKDISPKVNTLKLRTTTLTSLREGDIPIFVRGVNSSYDLSEVKNSDLGHYFMNYREYSIGAGDLQYWHERFLPGYRKLEEKYGKRTLASIIENCNSGLILDLRRYHDAMLSYRNERFVDDGLAGEEPVSPQQRDHLEYPHGYPNGYKGHKGGFFTYVDDFRLGTVPYKKATIVGNKLGRLAEGDLYRFFVVGFYGCYAERPGVSGNIALGMGRLKEIYSIQGNDQRTVYSTLLAALQKDPAFLLHVVRDFVPETFTRDDGKSYYLQSLRNNGNTMHLNIPELHKIGVPRKATFRQEQV